MISKTTRAKFIAQLKATGTLSSAADRHVISAADASAPRVVAVAALMRRQRDATGARWLPSTANLSVLP